MIYEQIDKSNWEQRRVGCPGYQESDVKHECWVVLPDDPSEVPSECFYGGCPFVYWLKEG